MTYYVAQVEPVTQAREDVADAREEARQHVTDQFADEHGREPQGPYYTPALGQPQEVTQVSYDGLTVRAALTGPDTTEDD